MLALCFLQLINVPGSKLLRRSMTSFRAEMLFVRVQNTERKADTYRSQGNKENKKHVLIKLTQ